jgi:hypothetical protein
LHWLAGMETDPMNKKNTTFEGLSNETLRTFEGNK